MLSNVLFTGTKVGWSLFFTVYLNLSVSTPTLDFMVIRELNGIVLWVGSKWENGARLPSTSMQVADFG
jgi:hypothetical protein